MEKIIKLPKNFHAWATCLSECESLNVSRKPGDSGSISEGVIEVSKILTKKSIITEKVFLGLLKKTKMIEQPTEIIGYYKPATSATGAKLPACKISVSYDCISSGLKSAIRKNQFVKEHSAK